MNGSIKIQAFVISKFLQRLYFTFCFCLVTGGQFLGNSFSNSGALIRVACLTVHILSS